MGNRVWLDEDEDGVQDPGEPGIGGVPVTLTITYPSGAEVVIVTVTEPDGFYSFENLIDEDYIGDGGPDEPVFVLSMTPPSGYAPSPVGQSGPATDSDDPEGTNAQPVKGQIDTTLLTNPNDETQVARIDFGVFPVVDVDLVKRFTPMSPQQGDEVTFILEVSNAPDASEATNVEVTDVVLAGFEYVGGSIGGGDNADESGAPTLRWTIDSLPPGGSVQLTFRATIVAVGNLRNFAEVTGTDQTDRDSTPSNGDDGEGPDEDDDDVVLISPRVPAPAPALGPFGLLAAFAVLLAVSRRRWRRW